MVNPPPIHVEHLTLRFGQREVLRDLSGTFEPGSLTALIGPNGAGKTTLLRAIAGLHPPSGGRIERGNLPPHQIALLPQSSALDRAFPITCRDVVAMGMIGRVGAFRSIGREDLRRTEAALEAVGLPGCARRPIGALSAGQFQRVLFARMMVQDAPILLLDEPFNAIDATTQADLLNILRGWHAEGRTIVTVLHDLDLVQQAFPSVLLLASDHVIWGPTALILTDSPQPRAELSRPLWALPRQHAA